MNNVDKGSIYFIGVISIIYAFFLFQIPTQVYVAFIALPFLCWSIWIIWRNPSILIFGFFVSSVLFFDSKDGITLYDAVYFSISAIIILLLALYLIRNAATAFTSLLDYTFLIFYLMLIYGVIIGLISGTSPIKVVSEISYYLPVFGYFFYRDLLKVKQYQLIFLVLIVAVILFVELRNFYYYREIILQATFNWQAENARMPLNEVILLFATILSAVFSMLYKDYRVSILALILFGSSVAAIILTQSRGYWLSLIVSMSTLLIITTNNERKRLLAILGALSIGAYAFAILLFDDFIFVVLEGLISRFQSIGSGSLDISLLDRFVESQTVFEKIMQSPITGHGLGTTFRREYVSAQTNYFEDMSFIHNGYLMAWFKFGFFGLLFFLWLSYQILKSSYSLHKKQVDTVYKLLALVIFCCLAGMLVVNLTSPQFLHFESILLITVFSAFLSSQQAQLNVNTKN